MDSAKVFTPARSKYLVFTADYILPLSISLGVIFLAYFTLYSPFFAIDSLTCTLDYEPCTNSSILVEIDKLKGRNIFTLVSSDHTKRLTSGDFTIREASVERQLPRLVHVSLRSVYPVVAVQVIGDSSWIVMDSFFRVIAVRTQDPNVPTVLVPGSLTLAIGKTPDDQLLLQSLKLARSLADQLFTFKTLTLVDESTIKLVLSDGKTAILTPKKDELQQLKVLQVVLGDATISKEVRTIDVRFSQPVLR
jgi:cell division septal protein FtsQ